MEIVVLSCVFALLGWLYLKHRRVTRAQWSKVERIIEAIHAGQEPSSFIFHGEPVWQRIGLGLEQLAEQRERLERQISQEEFDLQTILSSMAEGVIIVDQEHRIRLSNASLQELFEVNRSPVGLTVLHALRNAGVEEVIRSTLASGAASSREIGVGQRHLAVSASPVREKGEEIIGVAAIFRDITRLTQLEQVRREFVSNVSHELRTPLSIFQGYLEMLQDNPKVTPEELTATVGILQRHSKRLNLLVEDLLSIARLESRNESLTLAPLCIGAFLQQVEEDWRLKFEVKEVALILETQENLPSIETDRPRLEQVFNNLLENALNYTPAHGEVRLQAEWSADRAELEVRVRDTGAGVPATDLPHIFERFYRANKARNREKGGTGLGLSIVKHLVQAHGGSVSAESLLGRGTTIVIRLPISKPSHKIIV